MSRKTKSTNYTHFLTTQPLVEALWWFIENVNDEDQFRNEYFFALRERYRDCVQGEECQQAQLAARNLIDAGGTAPAMEGVPRRGRTEECPPLGAHMPVYQFNPPYKVEYDETGGYDCITPAYRVVDQDGRLLLTVDFKDFGQWAREPAGVQREIARRAHQTAYMCAQAHNNSEH